MTRKNLSRSKLFTLLLLSSSLLLCGKAAFAADPAAAPKGPAPIQFIRYEDDLSWYADPKNRELFIDKLKYIPISDSGYISFGGDLRTQYENYTPPNFGMRNLGRNEWLATRALFHVDIKSGFGPRAYIEFGREEIAGKKGPFTPNDESNLDLQQGFIDLPVAVGGGTVTARIGRQEFFLGSGLFQSLAEGANIRNAFDAAHVLFKYGNVEGRAFYGHPLRQSTYTFEDAPNLDLDHYGLYTTVKSVLPGLNVDGYFFGYDRKGNRFNQGTADEERRTVGTRLWGRSGPWDYSGDFAYQFGSFGSGSISAWGSMLSGGYSFSGTPMAPRLSVTAIAASGDRDPAKRTLNTFNPMFSLSPLLSESNSFVPMNLISVYPKVTVRPLDGLSISAGVNAMWRQSKGDGVYTVPTVLVARGAASSSSYVGATAEFAALWNVNHFVSVNAAYTHFKAGDALKEAGGKNFDYTRAGLLLHF
ncbi:alginate export family protein [Azospirillum lipoferum]|uniref:alginate export family protein n=1 Tax=Azospirillum lipoferum TaxID=193 RepID=UPI0005CAA550|nr:alginate export family protein [Azospirillum lipoferum]